MIGAAAAGTPTSARWRFLPRRLLVASGLAAAVTALAVGIRLVDPGGAPRTWVPPLLALASLCVGLLAGRRAPGLAWVALVVAALVASTVPVGVMQLVNGRPHTVAEWMPPAVAVVVAAAATAVVAALYATRPGRRLGDWVVPLVVVVAGWLAAACVLVVVLVAAGMRSDPAFTWADVATLPTTLYLHLVLLLVALGATGDVRDALGRADARLAEGSIPPTWRVRLRATFEELVPGNADRHERDVEAERRRLASDLHAVVLPSLRRAISEAEAGAGAHMLAARLRTVDLELERLMADRWPVVLETFGLVEALEELAERTQRPDVAIDIDVSEAAGRPPATVERAAYRVAQLALDNAIRHGSPSAVTIDIALTPLALTLVIADDGRGFDPQHPSDGRAGYGMADQRQRAAAVGGRLELGRSAAGGAAVTFTWPAAAAGNRGSSSVRRDG